MNGFENKVIFVEYDSNWIIYFDELKNQTYAAVGG